MRDEVSSEQRAARRPLSPQRWVSLSSYADCLAAPESGCARAFLLMGSGRSRSAHVVRVAAVFSGRVCGSAGASFRTATDLSRM